MPFNIKSCVEYARKGLRSTLYLAPGGYRAERFWKRRHLRYKFDMRGVGNCGLTHAENVDDYRRATEVFLEHCQLHNVDFKRARMLDIGCGTGHYADVFRQAGGIRYVGIDITDALFADLRQRHPDFAFRKLDVTQDPVDGIYDLVIMIDVTQHITDEKRFAKTLQHVKACMAPQGLFIVTSWLDESARRSFYEVSRSMDAYRREFPEGQFSQPVRYRDKYLFAIQRPETPHDRA